MPAHRAVCAVATLAPAYKQQFATCDKNQPTAGKSLKLFPDISKIFFSKKNPRFTNCSYLSPV